MWSAAPMISKGRWEAVGGYGGWVGKSRQAPASQMRRERLLSFGTVSRETSKQKEKEEDLPASKRKYKIEIEREGGEGKGEGEEDVTRQETGGGPMKSTNYRPTPLLTNGSHSK
eukprot:gene9269-6517_t